MSGMSRRNPLPAGPAISREEGTPIVALRDLRLTIPTSTGAVAILQGLDLDIAAGESVGVLGPSGSGKTSLLMVIAGLERGSGGGIRVAGQALEALDEEARALFRLRTLGIVFQSFHLIPTMTAAENVAVPLELAGRADAAQVAAGALEQVGLGHRLHHRPAQLSGGEQQRVAIARAFAPRPRLLLADEPTGSLDVETGRSVMDLLFALCAEGGTTLMLITHDPGIAARCGRIVTLKNGRIA
jgi:putative ABC transport system ATP-binding protein